MQEQLIVTTILKNYLKKYIIIQILWRKVWNDLKSIRLTNNLPCVCSNDSKNCTIAPLTVKASSKLGHCLTANSTSSSVQGVFALIWSSVFFKI